MLKAIKILLKDNLIIISIFVTISIGILSLIEPSKSTSLSIFKFENADKIQHFFSYFCLAICWLYTIKTAIQKRQSRFLVIITCIIYGIIIEVLQGTITTYRTADYKDIIANSVGALLALLIFNTCSSKK